MALILKCLDLGQYFSNIKIDKINNAKANMCGLKYSIFPLFNGKIYRANRIASIGEAMTAVAMSRSPYAILVSIITIRARKYVSNRF